MTASSDRLYRPSAPLRWKGGGLPEGRPAVMAILNCTPDSFFDGGQFLDAKAACGRAWDAVDAGADILDIGGESSRPGAPPVSVDEELSRVLPVLEGLASGPRPFPLPISIDTTKVAVAKAALDRGAVVVNDISGGTAEPEILRLAAERGAGVVLMHMRGTPRTMQSDLDYDDLIGEVCEALRECCERANEAGLPAAHQAVDPGVGFGKSAEGSLDLLASLERLHSLNRPILVGASRKSFLGSCFGQHGQDRLYGSLAVAAYAVGRGASILRVHDVLPTRLTVDVAVGLSCAAGRGQGRDA